MRAHPLLAGSLLAIAIATGEANAQAGGQRFIQMADANGDQALTLDEYMTWLAGVFGRINANGDDMVTTAEVDAIRARAAGRPADRPGRPLFDRADASGDGAVTAIEAEDSALARFQRLDRNGDGRLVAAELARRN